MADNLTPQQAVRGLRMPGIGEMINNASGAISNAATSMRNGASNLYNRMTGPADPITPAAQPAPAAAPVQPPAPAPAAAPVQPAPGMRPPIPTLTDVIEPGAHGPFLPSATNPNVPESGMSAQRVAYNAEQAARMGPAEPAGGLSRAEPLRPMGDMLRTAGGDGGGAGVVRGAADAAGDAARGLRSTLANNAPTKLGGLGSAVGAGMSFAPHWDALDDDSGMTIGQKAKLLVRDTSRAAGGIIGAGLGGTLGSVVPVAGTAAGGLAGGIAGYQLTDAAGGGLRRGANWINEKLGGSPDYITSTEDDLAAWRASHAPKAAATLGAAAAGTGATSAPAAPAPDDVASFNARMKQVGADGPGGVSMRAMSPAEQARANASTDGIGMRANANSRVLENTMPASKEMQAYTAQHMNERSAQLAAADETNREQAMRQHAQSTLMQDPDVMKLTDELQQAQRGGSPVAIQAIATARDNMIRTKSGDRQAETQADVSMRGQDTQLAGNRATNRLGMYNAMREQGNADRQYRREAGNDEFTHGEAAEKNMDDALTSRFTTGKDANGKPVVDAAAKAKAYTGIQQSAAALGANSVKDLSKQDRERLLASSQLIDKVNADASNILPWKPDVLGEIMPHDLLGLQKNSSGDWVVPRGAAKGRVIPARFLDKVEADRLGGKPTDVFNSLKAN